MDPFSATYENLVLFGDLNCEKSDPLMKTFCELYNFKSLINQPTCYKNPNNPSCIDLILTNNCKSFQDSQTLETGLSDFHKMILTVLKVRFKKKVAEICDYRDYKKFDNLAFIINNVINVFLF